MIKLLLMVKRNLLQEPSPFEGCLDPWVLRRKVQVVTSSQAIEGFSRFLDCVQNGGYNLRKFTSKLTPEKCWEGGRESSHFP